jgi:hypothetical protein
MELLKEITKWPDNTPNHSYKLNDAGKLQAYRKTGTKEWFTFNKPLPFSKSGRKFVRLKNE